MEYVDDMGPTPLARAQSLTKLQFPNGDDQDSNTFSPRTHLTLLDVLEQMESLDIDLGSMIELMKPMQPRLYTIASSCLCDANTVSVCIKLELEDPLKSTSEHDPEYQWQGVQSRYFLQSKVGSTFQYYIESS